MILIFLPEKSFIKTFKTTSEKKTTYVKNEIEFGNLLV
ncbi:hypothetical protein LEP1GSC125_2791 [Leptospira mayottensis 200901122]|uniref:Uncharacterized protein n=1 Tax=Leptospira mayottensis 200901122 TaxID=1193010 RepID=A0AA87SY85_9LEPT|nr:hypothetical protein LEP1GSC125_2791 [Leptospira mayottensis 200901122]